MGELVVLPYPPSANRYWRTFQNRVVKSTAAREYQSEVAWLLRAAGLEILEGPVSLTIRLYRPIRSGDLDNRIKVLLDALQGVAYLDDKQVVRLCAERLDDKKRPRAEVEIEAAT